LSRIFLAIPNSRKDSRQAGMTLKTNIQFQTPCGLCRGDFLTHDAFYGKCRCSIRTKVMQLVG
jgi:hypothetical protein